MLDRGELTEALMKACSLQGSRTAPESGMVHRILAGVMYSCPTSLDRRIAYMSKPKTFGSELVQHLYLKVLHSECRVFFAVLVERTARLAIPKLLRCACSNSIAVLPTFHICALAAIAGEVRLVVVESCSVKVPCSSGVHILLPPHRRAHVFNRAHATVL